MLTNLKKKKKNANAMSNPNDTKAREISARNGELPISKWPITDVEDLTELLQNELYDRNEALLQWAAKRGE